MPAYFKQNDGDALSPHSPEHPQRIDVVYAAEDDAFRSKMILTDFHIRLVSLKSSFQKSRSLSGVGVGVTIN